MATTTTVIHVHNSVTQPTSNVVLLFLQPVSAQDNYVYSAWNVLNPSSGSHQQVDLTTSFSASVAAIGSAVSDYTDPVGLTLGTPALVSNPNNQSPAIAGLSSRSITSDEVGLDNECITPDTDLSSIWYVNGNEVVQTNNTATTSLNPGFVSTFQLKQSVWVMFGQRPTTTTTYTVQTFNQAVQIPIPNGATDVYIEAYTDANGIDTFKSVSSADFYASVQRSGHPGDLPAVMLGEVSFKNNTGNQVELFYKVPGQSQGKEVDIAPFKTSDPVSGTLLTIDVVSKTQRWSYDFTGYQPNGLWVKDESPYTLLHVLGHNGKTMELVVRDNEGDTVADFIPAG
ncbi:MAG: hypothetical protein ACOYBY_15470 [Dermatophilaceae bacterium]